MSNKFLSANQAVLGGTAIRLSFFVIWLGLLVWFLLGIDGQYDFEWLLVFLFVLFIVGFPISLVGLVILMVTGWFFDLPDFAAAWVMVGMWILFFLLSICQWFVIIPSLISRYRLQSHKEG